MDSLASKNKDFIFIPPFQWGLRGDPYLWDELKERFIYSDYKTLDEFKQFLYKTFREITGQQIEEGKTFYVAAYNWGGMSGGSLSGDFWLHTAYPLLEKRFAFIQKHPEAVSLPLPDKSLTSGPVQEICLKHCQGKVSGHADLLLELYSYGKMLGLTKTADSYFLWDFLGISREESKFLSINNALEKLCDYWMECVDNISEGETKFLPFDLSDEYIAGLFVTDIIDMITLRYVYTSEVQGYSVDKSCLYETIKEKGGYPNFRSLTPENICRVTPDGLKIILNNCKQKLRENTYEC